MAWTCLSRWTLRQRAACRSANAQDLPLSRLPPLAGFVFLYAAMFAAFGAVSPFLPAYLADRGLPLERISLVIGLGTAVRVVSGPLLGRLADRRRTWRETLCACAAGAGALALAYQAAEGFGPVLLVALAQSAMLAPLVPIADALALAASAPHAGRRFDYGLVRGTGAAAFVAGSVAAGHLALSHGLAAGIWLNAALLAASAAAALLVPAIAPGPGGLRSTAMHDSLVLLRLPAFRRLLLVAALVLGSQALHDTFAVIRWRDAGITTATAGLLWSESVIGEVAVFLFAGQALLRWLGPAGAATLAAAAGVVRWSILGATVKVIPLMLSEPLHGLSFALFHLAAMRVIDQATPRHLAATAQALYTTLAAGTAIALVTLASGFLYTLLEGGAFFVMALLCAAAIPLAARMRT